MPPDKNQNINLIPSDLERKRQVIKKVIAQASPEYTEAQNGHPSAPSFWSRLFTSQPKIAAPSNGTPRVVAVPPTQLPTRPLAKPVPAPVITKPELKPNFLNTKPLPTPPAKPAPAPVAPKKETSQPPPPSQPPPVETPVIENKKTGVKKIEMTTAANGGPKEPGGGDNFGVNLLAGEYAQAFVAQNQKSFFAYAVGAALVLLALIYVGLQLYQMQTAGQIARSQAANVELEGAINSFSDLDKEDKLLGRKVGVIKELLIAHISTRAFLEKLESATIPEVTFLALAASQEGGVTVTARATSYTTLARQLAVLQEDAPWIKAVSVASAGLVRSNQGAEEGVEFDMVMQVDPKIFKVETDK